MQARDRSKASLSAVNLEAELKGGSQARPARLDVAPVDGGWRLVCPATGDLMFLSGGRAEQCARQTALLLAQLGHEVEVRIHDRFNNIAGTIHYFAEDDLAGDDHR
ncbi:hypothetical protein P7B02_02345 [Caulobacter segnis]|uniref:hypothetical protein n=1 Tax=Caulobacter segnis TaxID=88688 RepID=UPI00240F690E|nr:hypothetical protein [Caulobacter segnis]MDG2520367.1 hypothetical protein [Caulobacter segnis]